MLNIFPFSIIYYSNIQKRGKSTMYTQPFSILTWNIYYGASITPLVGASPEQIPAIVTNIFQQFLATNFPARAQAIARVIATNTPDLIGLQEAAKWTVTVPNYSVMEYDFIKLLLCELANLGQYYHIGALNLNSSETLPSSDNTLISLEDRDVILVRDCSGICILDDQRANFTTNTVLPIGNQSVTAKQGWSYIDAYLNNFMFRMITTHLDAASASVRLSQLNELLAGPANTSLPVFLTGDFNSDAITNDIVYQTLLAAGFQDAFAIAGTAPGFTAHQSSNLLNTTSTLSQRIDFILFKNATIPMTCAYTVGDSQADRICSGLWPSDHAGVIARLGSGCSCL